MIKKSIFVIFFFCSISLSQAMPLIFIKDASERVYLTEVATTPQEQAKGLMYRLYMLPWQGMLFIFQPEQNLSFWMKNTYLPLNIRFFDKNGKLVAQHPYAGTCFESPCPIYSSISKATYALETRSNYQFINPQADKIELLIPFIY